MEPLQRNSWQICGSEPRGSWGELAVIGYIGLSHLAQWRNDVTDPIDRCSTLPLWARVIPAASSSLATRWPRHYM